jgi:lysophospholipase L1-like esterase
VVDLNDDARARDAWRVAPLLLAAGLLAAAIGLSPGRVETFLTLQWVAGDMRRAVQAIRVVALLGAAATLFWRHRVSRALRNLRARDVLAGAALFVISTSAALVVAELVLRYKGYPFSGSWTPSETALARFDDTLGWSYRAGLTTAQPIGRPRVMVTMTFDSAGIRVDRPGHVFSRTAPTILFIGDSFTFGHGVDYDSAFPARVERLLGGRVQAVNLGVQGFGTDQSLLALLRHIDAFNTRLVVYTYLRDHLSRNDNYDRRMLYPVGRWLGSKPLFGVRPDDSAYLRRRPLPIADLGRLHLLQVAQLVWTRWGPQPDPRLTTALVREVKRVCDARGVPLLVVNWTRQDPGHTGLSRVWNEPPDAEILGGAQVEVLDLGLNAPPDWTSWRIPGDGHPTPQAHQRVAGLIAQWVERHDSALARGR